MAYGFLKPNNSPALSNAGPGGCLPDLPGGICQTPATRWVYEDSTAREATTPQSLEILEPHSIALIDTMYLDVFG